uniref:Uncharacterized protein n=1 Tax=Ixodes scapularis TaxID=6945 RepID=A0A4D5RYV8_IXOSC
MSSKFLPLLITWGSLFGWRFQLYLLVCLRCTNLLWKGAFVSDISMYTLPGLVLTVLYFYYKLIGSFACASRHPCCAVLAKVPSFFI